MATTDREWAAWKRMYEQLQDALGEDLCLGKYRSLIACIRLWGEELATVRLEQGEEGIAAKRDVVGQEASVLIERQNGHQYYSPLLESRSRRCAGDGQDAERD